MFHVLQTILFRPLLTLFSCRRRQIGALWKDNQPHRVFWFIELGKVPLESSLVLFPLSGEEDEVVELHALHSQPRHGSTCVAVLNENCTMTHPAQDRHPLQAVLEDNEDVFVGSHEVRQRPRVPPVCVDL